MADTFAVDRTVADARPSDYDALVLRWVDEEVVEDEGLVSSRAPDDLPAS